MSTTVILGIVIVVLLVIIIMLLLSSSGNSSKHKEELPPPAEQQFNTTFTPNTALNQTAPLVKGKKKDKPAPFINEEQLAEAGKDETFLPQTTSNANLETEDEDGDALTKSE